MTADDGYDESLFATLMEEIYVVATQLDGITKITEHLARATRSRSCGLMIQNRDTYRVEGGWYWGIDWDWGVAYRDTYYAVDPTVVEHFQIPSGKAYASRFNRDDAEFRETRFFREWCAPQQLGYFAGAYLHLEGDSALRLTFQGDDRRGAYEPQSVALIEALLPHIRRAVDINRRVSQLLGHSNAFSLVLDQSQNAIILLNVQGRMVYCNSAAKTMHCDGLALRDGGIHIHAPEARRQFDLAFAGCIANLGESPAPQMQAGVHVAISRRGLLPLSLYVSPVRLRASPADPLPSDLVMLQLIDPEVQLLFDAEQLKEVMTLTVAESRVAARLCRGDSATDIAEALSLSPYTVRDHVKHIYLRVGVSKQSEFVARAYSVLRLRAPSSQKSH
ncbi:MAG TPA: LuxR C-terminal-related transcriptional regulator [Solimonas sp.]|nr:LuxR C-terminal-related transcriptional regulator [Solimonas sp.]